MAGNAVIGALRVVLGLDSAALTKGLKESQGAFSSFGKSIATIASGIGLERVFERLGASIGNSIKRAVAYGDELNKASQKYGVPVEKLAELKYAADLADVSFESLSSSLARFNRNIVDAGRGQGQALEAFHVMGIEIRNSNGSLKSSSDLLGEVAAKFATYKDSAEKTALAMALFGRSGADLIPLLNLGKTGLEAAAEEARKFGLVLDKDATSKTEEFNDNLRRLGIIWDGIFIKLMGQSIGVLKEVSAVLVRFGNSINIQPIWQSIVTTMKEAIAVGYFFITVIQRIGAEWNAFTRMFTSDNAARMAAQRDFINETQTTVDVFKNLGPEIAAFIKQLSSASDGFNKTGDSASRAAPGLGKFGEGVKKLQGYLDGIVKQTAAMDAQGATIGRTAYETDRLRIINEALAIAGTKNVDVNSRLYQSIVRVADAHALSNERANLTKQVYDQTRTPLETLTARVNELNDAMERSPENADIFARGIDQAAKQFAQSNVYFQAFEQAVSSAFDRAIEGTMKFSEVLKGLLKDLAKAMANAAFKQLLFSGTSPGTGILSSLFGSLFGGSGKVPGFATGGSFTVGGSGGLDSQLVAFRATPGEQVAVGTAGNGAGGELTVRVLLDNDMLRAVVQDESGKVVARAAPRIVDAATAQAVQAVPVARRRNPSYFG